MKNFLFWFCFAFSLQSGAQSVDDWTWYEDPDFNPVISSLAYDANGNLWVGAGSKVIVYNSAGEKSVKLNLADLGLGPDASYVSFIDASLTHTIWVTTLKHLFSYDVDADTWTKHTPPYDLTYSYYFDVESANSVWWYTNKGLLEYDGSNWNTYIFPPTTMPMVPNNISGIAVDPNHNKWLSTYIVACLDIPCPETYGGLIQLNDSDTLYFDANAMGFEKPREINVAIDVTGNPIVIATSFLGNQNTYKKYVNDVWSNPVSIPASGYIYDACITGKNKLVLAISDNKLIVESGNGNWFTIPVDLNSITHIFKVEPTEQGLFVAAQKKLPDGSTIKVIGYFPDLRYSASGMLFSDRNSNVIFDGADLPLQDVFVEAQNQNRLTLSDEDGDYILLFKDPGVYNVQGILPAYHSYQTPADGTYPVVLYPAVPSSTGNNFGYLPDLTALDMTAKITALNRANPGSHAAYMINIKNIAPSAASGEVLFTFDNRLNFISSSPPPASVNGNQISYSLSDLEWLQTQSVKLHFYLPPDLISIGDTLKLIASVTVNGGADFDPSNDADTLCQIVTGPFDPNYITVKPKGEGPGGNIPPSTQQLEYTIHFQNVGNDTAKNVTILNLIGTDLDLASINVTGFSHPYKIALVDDGRKIKWSFLNIKLPDSTTNPIESSGFIRYTIKPGTHLNGTKFRNNADIFFDYNQPVRTNTTVNTIKIPVVSIPAEIQNDFCGGRIWVNRDQLRLQFNNIDKYKIDIFDLNGQNLYGLYIYHKEALIPLENLPPGAYIVSVQSESCSRSAKLFFK